MGLTREPMPPAPPRLLPDIGEGSRFQIETWSDSLVHRLLIVAQGHGLARAYLAAKDDSTGMILTGTSLVGRCPSHHDREVLGAVIELEPATALDMVALSAFERVSPFPTRLWDLMMPPVTGDAKFHLFRNVGPPARSSARVYLDKLTHRTSYPGQDADEARGREHGYHPLSTSRLLAVGDGEVISAAGRGMRPASVTQFARDGRVESAIIAPAVMSALSEFTQLHGGPVMRMLGAKGWSPQAYAYFALPGPVGERRRQAAGLYPSLAPVIATSESLRDLVDAGRPFERSLRDRVALLVPVGSRGSFGIGALRRMRGLPASTEFVQVEAAAAMAARLPVDWLPTDARGWEVFREKTRCVTNRLDRLGLDWADYAGVTGPDWTAFGVLEEDGKRPGASLTTVRSLSDAMDMVRHFGQTLLRPVNRALGLGDDNEDLEGEIENLVGGRILFGGKGFKAVHEVQAGWHRDLPTLEAALPVNEGGNAWPALFERFDAGGGIHLVCLSMETELKAEGGRGPDADGMMGLAHCVGSYAEQCYHGNAHVASVRRIDAEGRVTRLSTVELSASGGMADRPEVVVEQHLGYGNGEPPDMAYDAVDAFEAAVREGRVNLNPEAFVERSPGGFCDGYDWREPGAVEQAFAAWRRHLPREIARGGLEALVRYVAADREVDPDPALRILIAEPDAGFRP